MSDKKKTKKDEDDKEQSAGEAFVDGFTETIVHPFRWIRGILGGK